MSKKLLSILFGVFLLFNVAAPAFADTVTTTDSTLTTTQTTTANQTSSSQELSDAGILPGSPFYFLDQMVEKIVLMFTFSPEGKANDLLQDANERLAESQVLANDAKQDLATKTAQAYVNTLQEAQVQVTIALQDNQVSGSVYSPVSTAGTVSSVVYGQKDSSVVAVVYGLDISQRHAAQVLLRVMAKAPEQARKGLMNAFANVIKHAIMSDGNVSVVINGQTVNIGDDLRSNLAANAMNQNGEQGKEHAKGHAKDKTQAKEQDREHAQNHNPVSTSGSISITLKSSIGTPNTIAPNRQRSQENDNENGNNMRSKMLQNDQHSQQGKHSEHDD